MGKRKRDFRDSGDHINSATPEGKPSVHSNPKGSVDRTKDGENLCVQVITGSYDRVLHGFTATIDSSHLDTFDSRGELEDGVSFADTFLFNAHASAVRSLALSPFNSDSQNALLPTRLVLASGSTDERINLYSISANTPPHAARAKISVTPTLSSVAKLENPKNREIGALLHHSSTITKLCFATKSKLLSASEDNTIAVSRSRDWTVLSTMRAPVPQAYGRPSGDTAAPGKTPAGINDFDFDPSMKIMISVGKGERCMRLWNLVTGKKAGALNFNRELLQEIGENRFHSGEGQKVLFKPDGDGFVIGFERSAVIFNMESEIQGIIVPTPRTKFHQMRFLPSKESAVLAISTEDGRILLYNTQASATGKHQAVKRYHSHAPVGQLGGPSAGVASRVKDFEILPLTGKKSTFLVVTAGSDGAIRVWFLDGIKFLSPSRMEDATDTSKNSSDQQMSPDKDAGRLRNTPQIARLLGRYETANRITCMKAFVMLPGINEPEESNSRSKKKIGSVKTKNVIDEDESDSDFEGFD